MTDVTHAAELEGGPGLRIVAIKPTQRDANRATVRVAAGPERKGRVVVTLNVRRIAELGLAVGQVWDEALEARVADTALFDKAMRQAMNRISSRPMSRRALDRKLRDKEHAEPVRVAVLDRLEELGLLDDLAYARMLVRDLQLRKPAGPALLKSKLYEKGIDARLIDQVVGEATSDTRNQLDAAMDLARKKSASMARLDPAVRRRRLYGQLARRGFSPDTLREVMERIAREENADGPGE